MEMQKIIQPVRPPTSAPDGGGETRNKRWRDVTLAEVHTMLQQVLALLQAPQPADRETELLSVGEIARRWSVSQRTVWRKIRSGQLPSTQIGVSRRARLSDVLRIEEEGNNRKEA